MGNCIGDAGATSNAAAFAGEGAEGVLSPAERKLAARKRCQIAGKKIKQVYQFGEELGSGAYSTVVRGARRDGGQPAQAAIKCVNRARLSQEDAIALYDEVSILQKLKHPGVMALHEFYEEQETAYLVTELIVGGELFDRIVARTTYTEEVARDLIRNLLSIIAELHERGIVHRDLKPENLLLMSKDDDVHIKLADFGFAVECSLSEHSLETVCGTPDYIAPEIITRKKKYGCECDVWSAGVIAYILLGGYPPFYHDNQKELFRLIQGGTYEFHSPYWDHISTEAQDLIARMLTVKPSKRPTARKLLSHKWLKQSADTLGSRDIGKTLPQLKRFNARRKFRAGVRAVVAVNRFRLALSK